MKHRRNVLSIALSLIATVALAQNQADFVHQTYAAPPSVSTRAAVDLNSDGYTDVVTNGPNQDSVYVLFSNGSSGGFQTAREYPVGAPVRAVTGADVDGDGNADIVAAVFDGSGPFEGVAILFGNGDGTFSAPVFAGADIIPDTVAVADFTGDGRRDILITGGHVSGDNNYYAGVIANKGARNFSFSGDFLVSNDNVCCDFTALGVGDLDGDGHEDFFVQRDIQARGPNTTILVYTAYGDGAGHFTTGPSKTFNGNVSLAAADLNSDGKTDIVGSVTVSDPDPSTGNATTNIFVMKGNSGRTLTETDLLTFADAASGIQVADFNGDGFNDIAFETVDGQTGTAAIWLGLQQSDGAFTIQKTGYAVTPGLLGDFDHDGRPDLAQANGAQSNTLEVLYNRTQDSFNFCAAPEHGISACSPADGSTITINSPNVMFSVGAADFSPIRKLEVWENGSKLIQQFYGYFDYAFLSVPRQFSTGKHTVTLLATGYDHVQMKKDVTFTVGSSSGCSTPTSGIHVCDPVDNSAVSAPSSVHAIATGMAGTARMEVLVDGSRKASVSGAHLDVHFTLGVKGTRKITFNSYNSSGTKTATKTLTMTVK